MLYHKAKKPFNKSPAFRSFISVIFAGVKKNRIATLLVLVLQLNIALPALAASTLNGDRFSYLFSTLCTSMGTKVVSSDGDIGKSHQQKVHCATCAAGGSPPQKNLSPRFTWHLLSTQVIAWMSESPISTKNLWSSSSARAPPAII
jgi:hypothetical protein